MRQTIVYMVAVVVDSNNKVTGYRLFNLGLNKCVIVYKEKLLELMQKGYEISNLKLSSHGKIEVVPKSCQIKRYTWLDEHGDIKEKHIHNVLLSKYKGKYNRRVCLLYNNITNRTEIFEYNLHFGNNIDYVANVIDLQDELENTVYSKLISYWEHISKEYNKFKWKIDKNLNLVDFAIYAEGTFNLNACIWIENMHHSICDEININGLVYGIGYQGIKQCRIGRLNVDVDFMESEAIIDSEIGELTIDGTTWFTGANLIKSCKIGKLVIGESIELNKNILINCDIDQIEFKGIKIKGIKEGLMENCSGLKYITLNKQVDDNLYELISKLVGGDTKIIMV